MTYPIVLLADNSDISQHAFTKAQKLRREIAHAVECREDYVAGHGLDPSFCLPAGNWGEDAANDFLLAYRHVRDGGYDVLNRLRFWVPFFSGYHLLGLTDEQIKTSVMPIPPDHDRWMTLNRSEPDKWVKLWVNFSKTIPDALRFSPPVMLGEIGWRVDGIVVNHDTYVYQERVNILYEAGIVDWLQRLGRPPRILEIGGGYGALALALLRILPSASYMICDLPESLIFAGLYLTLCEQAHASLVQPNSDVSAHLSEAGVNLLPNYMLHVLLDHGASFDLVINTLSMSEMSETQVHAYAAAIARLIGPSGVFFEQNQNNRGSGLIDCKDYIRGHFPWSRRLRPQLATRREGRVNLWANAAPAFYRAEGELELEFWRQLEYVENLVDEQKARLEMHETTVDDRTSRLLAHEAALDERNYRLRAMEQTLEERNERLRGVEYALDEKSQRILALEATLVDRDQRLKWLEVESRRRIWNRIRRLIRFFFPRART